MVALPWRCERGVGLLLEVMVVVVLLLILAEE